MNVRSNATSLFSNYKWRILQSIYTCNVLSRIGLGKKILSILSSWRSVAASILALVDVHTVVGDHTVTDAPLCHSWRPVAASVHALDVSVAVMMPYCN
jgi:hypothetical protein